jgi:hypothetical protein
MVIKDAFSLFKVLDTFDFSSKKELEALENVLEVYPDFHLVRTYFLKAVQELKPEAFDKQLSHTAIATYNRNLLYDFIENQEKSSIKVTDNLSISKINAQLKEPKKNKLKETKVSGIKKSKKTSKFQETENTPESLTFADWAHYLKTKKILNKEEPTLEDKFKLIDGFIANTQKIVPEKNSKNNIDLSEISWTSSDELMTETLAKVFVKQQKYTKALQAYQILGLKYPEKNSFFANQIKEIKRLQKLKD